MGKFSLVLPLVVFTLLAFPTIAWAQTGEEDQCLCPCSETNTTRSTTCEDALLVCQNGGTMAPRTCRVDPSAASPCLPWDATTVCDCNPGFLGTHCQIQTPESCSLAGLVYDGSVLNGIHTRNMECFAGRSDTLSLLDLTDHRFNFQLDPIESSARFQLYTRQRDGGPGSTLDLCRNMKQYFDCKVRNCVLVGLEDQEVIELRCPDKNCTAVCPESNGCNAILKALMDSFVANDEPFRMRVAPLQNDRVNVTFDIISLLPIVVDGRCVVGACKNKTDEDSDIVGWDGERISTKSDGVSKAGIGISASIAILLYISLFVLAIYANVEISHPPAPICQMLADHARRQGDPESDPVLVRPLGEGEINEGSAHDTRNGFEGTDPSMLPPLGPIPIAGSRDDIDAPIDIAATSSSRFGLVWRDVSFWVPEQHGLGLLPFVPFFQRLCSSRVKPPPGAHKVLCGVSGAVFPGEIVAILGPSGAGKSTLLDILGGVARPGKLSGEICVYSESGGGRVSSASADAPGGQNVEVASSGSNLGQQGGGIAGVSPPQLVERTISAAVAQQQGAPAPAPPPQFSSRNVLSYVMQDDVMLGTVTVWEALLFSARMRLPAKLSEADIFLRVRRIMEELSLVGVAHHIVGNVGGAGTGLMERRGLSGGERRRLALGVELIANPRVILSDEPTSGLDSFYADIVIGALRRRAVEGGAAVLLSIHQPPAHLFPHFHRIMLLASTGELAFCGTPGEALTFFESRGGQLSKGLGGHGAVAALYASNPFEALMSMLSDSRSSFRAATVKAFRTSFQAEALERDVAEKLASATSGGVTPTHNYYSRDGKTNARDKELFASMGSMGTSQNSGSGQAKDVHVNGSGSRSTPAAAKSPGDGPVNGGPGGSASPSSAGGPVGAGSLEITPSREVSQEDPGAVSTTSTGRRTPRHLALTPQQLHTSPTISSLRQTWLLTSRLFRHIARDPTLLLMYNVIYVVVAACVGGVYYNTDNTTIGIQNRTGFLFFAILFVSLMSMSQMGVFVMERALLRRESYSGFYNAGPYFASKVLVDFLPFRVLPPILFSAIAYWMVGLQEDATHFLRFIGVLILTNLVASGGVFFISSAAPDIGRANMFGTLYFIFSMGFGGLLLNVSQDKPGVRGFSYLSFMRYGYEGLMNNEFHDLSLLFNLAGLGSVTLNVPGDLILEQAGFSYDNMTMDVVVLSCAFVVLMGMSYLTLLVRCRRNKRSNLSILSAKTPRKR
eukprot:jgi/Mesvir1/20573/Mv14814-RA.1